MKKLFALMVVLCLWIPLCAFKDVTSGAVINLNGSVNEVITIRYSNEDAQTLDLTFEQLHTAASQIPNSIQTNLQAKFQTKITNDTSLSISEKQILMEQIKIVATTKIVNENEGQFVLNITYETKSAWNCFCGDVIDKTEETTETSFFIKNYVTKMPIKLSSIQDNDKEVSLLDYTHKLFTTKLTQELNKDIQPILSQNYAYVYATNIARLHSDAKETEYNSTTGLTYFLWEFDVGNSSPQITFWQTRANAVSWYCLALGFTVVLGVILLVCTKSKKQKQDT